MAAQIILKYTHVLTGTPSSKDYGVSMYMHAYAHIHDTAFMSNKTICTL